jgi:hypothetical protein
MRTKISDFFMPKNLRTPTKLGYYLAVQDISSYCSFPMQIDATVERELSHVSIILLKHDTHKFMMESYLFLLYCCPQSLTCSGDINCAGMWPYSNTYKNKWIFEVHMCIYVVVLYSILQQKS